MTDTINITIPRPNARRNGSALLPAEIVRYEIDVYAQSAPGTNIGPFTITPDPDPAATQDAGAVVHDFPQGETLTLYYRVITTNPDGAGEPDLDSVLSTAIVTSFVPATPEADGAAIVAGWTAVPVQ